MDKRYTVGIDIGGQSSKIGIVSEDAEIVARGVLDMKGFGPDDATLFLDSLCAEVSDLASGVGLEEIKGIGIGAPNSNYYNGTIEKAVNLPWAKDKVVHLCDGVSRRLGLPATVTNDANAAALGEMTYGAAQGMKDFIEITLGTGVGSGIVSGGKLVYGHDGFAGELGHVTAVRGGRRCGCGRNGCLEAYASATGVARTAREWLDDGNRDSILRGIENITSKDVYDAAVKGDATAVRIFEYTGRILGECFADFVTFSAPEAIIIFGGLMEAGDLLLNPIRESFEENVLFVWKDKVKIMRSGLRASDAAILGASALAW
ncbi:MAG: ROK family protein [Bacteroidales bacterium]|nr:ROK family protein [Bacteroidales bacterium]